MHADKSHIGCHSTTKLKVVRVNIIYKPTGNFKEFNNSFHAAPCSESDQKQHIMLHNHEREAKSTGPNHIGKTHRNNVPTLLTEASYRGRGNNHHCNSNTEMVKFTIPDCLKQCSVSYI